MKTILSLLFRSSHASLIDRPRTDDEKAARIDQLRALVPISYMLLALSIGIVILQFVRWEHKDFVKRLALVFFSYVALKSILNIIRAKAILNKRTREEP